MIIIIIDLFVSEVKGVLRKFAPHVTPQDEFTIEMACEKAVVHRKIFIHTAKNTNIMKMAK